MKPNKHSAMDGLEELCIEVSSVVNPFYFNQVSDEKFRQEVVKIVRVVIDSSKQQQDTVEKIDSKVISKVFFDLHETNHGCIDWKSLASNFDENRRRVSERSSPLEIFFDILMNPIVVPISLTDAIVMGLLSVCVDISSHSFHSDAYTRASSLKFIENHILILLYRRPLCLKSDVFGNFLRSYLKRMIDCSSKESFDVRLLIGWKAWLLIRDLSSTTHVKDNRTISVKRMISPMLILENIIEFIRNIDDNILQYPSNQRCSPCCKCSSDSGTTREMKPKRAKIASIQHIHDEVSDCEDESKKKFFKNHRYHSQASIESISSKTILAATSLMLKKSYNVCRHQNMTTGNVTTYSMRFLSFLYKFLVENLQLLASNHSTQLDYAERKFVYLACKYSSSSSVRLCAMLISSHNPKPIFSGVLSNLIRRINGFREIFFSNGVLLNRMISYLNMYLEIVCKCRCFDDPSLCRSATVSLIEAAFLCDVESSPLKVLLLLRCIGWLISRRVNTLLQDDVNQMSKLNFNALILRLACNYGTLGYWIDESMIDEEQQEIYIGLQTAGILSFADRSLEYDYWTSKQKYICSLVRPYSVLDSSEATLYRSGLQINLLSNSKCYNVVASNGSSTKPKRERDDNLFAEPLMDYLNEDLIKCVLSFLGYKKLVQVSMVCKSWNEIANQNDLWKGHYSRRYRLIFIEDFLPPSVMKTEREEFINKFSVKSSLDWKKLFREKLIKERSESKRRAGQLKYKCCSLIGCKTILRNIDDHNRHRKVHENICAKRLELIRGKTKRKRKSM